MSPMKSTLGIILGSLLLVGTAQAQSSGGGGDGWETASPPVAPIAVQDQARIDYLRLQYQRGKVSAQALCDTHQRVTPPNQVLLERLLTEQHIACARRP